MYETHLVGETIKDCMMCTNITLRMLAQKTGLTKRLLRAIIAGRKVITIETAEALTKAFSLTAQFWLNLQMKAKNK